MILVLAAFSPTYIGTSAVPIRTLPINQGLSDLSGFIILGLLTQQAVGARVERGSFGAKLSPATTSNDAILTANEKFRLVLTSSVGKIHWGKGKQH